MQQDRFTIRLLSQNRPLFKYSNSHEMCKSLKNTMQCLKTILYIMSSTSFKSVLIFTTVRCPSQATLDSLDLTRLSEDSERSDDVAVLEFELRKAKETINALRANLTQVTGESYPGFICIYINIYKFTCKFQIMKIYICI